MNEELNKVGMEKTPGGVSDSNGTSLGESDFTDEEGSETCDLSVNPASTGSNTSVFTDTDLSILTDEIEDCERVNEKRREPQRKQRKLRKPGAVKAKMTYPKYEGTFSLKSESWNEVWDWKKSDFKARRKWRVLFKTHIKAFRPFCKHNFKDSGIPHTSEVTNKVEVRAYTYCGTGNCKHYSFHWTLERGKDLEIVVNSEGEENHENALTNTLQVKHGERDILHKRVENKPTYTVKKEDIKNLDGIVYADKNWQDVKPDNVYWHARSEVLSKDDLHKDDFIDLVFRRRREIGSDKSVRYIQSVAEPLVVHLFSEVTVRAILDFFMNRLKINVHGDATGKLIRANVYYGRTIYLYSFVVNVSGTLIPLFQMISAIHDQGAIGEVLSRFRMFVINDLHRKWPCIGRIVTDCSFAIIHAIMREWNGTTLQKYLTACYFYVQGTFTDVDFNEVVIARLCKNHWIKMCCNSLKGYLYEGGKKTVIMESIVKLMECTDMKQFDDTFTNFAVIITCPVNHHIVDKAFSSLSLSPREMKTKEFEEPKTVNIADQLDEHKFADSSETYEHTPFHIHCSRLVDQVEKYIKKSVGEDTLDKYKKKCEDRKKKQESEEDCDSECDDEGNWYYCPSFLKNIFFKNHHAALVPFWSKVMDKIRSHVCTDFEATNADVEGYYKLKKKYIHKDSLRDKPGRFICKDKEDVLKGTKAILLGLRTDGKPFSEVTVIEDDHTTSIFEDDGFGDKVSMLNVKNKIEDDHTTSIFGDDGLGDKVSMLNVKNKVVSQTQDGKQSTQTTVDTHNISLPSSDINNPNTQAGLDLTQSAQENWSTPSPKYSYSQGLRITKVAQRRTSTPCKGSAPGITFDMSELTEETSETSKASKRKLFDGEGPKTSARMEKQPAKRLRLSLAGKKDSWKRVDKSCTPSRSTVFGKFSKESSLQAAASISNQRIAAKRDEYGVKSQVTIADCEITEVLQETVEERIQQSHYVAYRTDLQYRAAPFINVLDSSDCAFIDAQTNGDVSALLFVYGIEDHPIYLKDFTQLLH